MRECKLSVIILSYNTGKFLNECFFSTLESAKRLKGVEIIIVDNASTDGTDKLIRNLKNDFDQKNKNKDLEFVVIFSQKNLGYAGGNNLGIKKSRGKYILFLNMDINLSKSALEDAVNFMESDQKIGAMTPKTMLFSGGIDPDCHRGFPTPWASITYFLGLEKLFPKSRLFGQYHKFYEDLTKPHEIDAGFGTFMIVRREVVDKVGLWDEKYFFYGEDLDYFYRIKQAGYKVMFYPKVLLRHYKGGSSGLRKESRQTTAASKETRLKTARASIKAMEIFYKKFYKDQYPAWLTFLILSAIKIKGFFRVAKHSLS